VSLPGAQTFEIDTIQVETTSWCNLKCRGCLRTSRLGRGAWADRHMTGEAFAQLLRHLPACRVLILNGTGEPMLNPDIAEIVGQARRSGKFQGITFNSNALAREVEDFVRVAQAGLSFLSVSVDSLTPDIAELVRSGTRASKLGQRIADLARLLPVPLTITMVVSRANLFDVAETLEKLNAIGRFTVFLTEMSDVELLDGQPSLEGSIDAQERRLLHVMAAKLSLRLENLDITLTQPLETGGVRCLAPFRHPFVNVDGFLTPCCTLTDAGHYGAQNVFDRPLQDAFMAPEAVAWREAYGRGEPAACQGCQHRKRD
jgi:MoaA/NifB/PqqE/SkfB family radical SAM enzyme